MREHIELLQLDQGVIRVAEYLTRQLPAEQLEQELHNAIRRAREQLAQRQPAAIEGDSGADESGAC